MRATSIHQPVGSVTRGEPITVVPTATLREAASILADEHVGLILVEDRDGLRGVVSERDIVAALAEGSDPDVDRLDEIMTTDVASIGHTEPVVSALKLMLANEIRHVTVVDRNAPVGVVSMRDVAAAFLADIMGDVPRSA